MEQRAEFLAEKRSGYTKESTLGDRETQRRVSLGEDVGVVLESQRVAALSTPGTRDEQFYANELSKHVQNEVERSSAFHHLTKDEGIVVAENPHEMRGDLAVEFLKGSPDKRSEFFSPVSGRMREYLPGEGRGLQETMWDAARTGKTPQGSYMRAIEVINSSKGGLVTGTMGRPNDQGPGRTSPGGGGGAGAGGGTQELPAPFISGRTTEERIIPTGELPFLGVVPVVSGIIAAGQTGFENAGLADKQFLVTKARPGPLREEKTVASKMAGGKSDFMYKISTSPGGLDTAEWTPSRGEKVTVTETDPFPVGDPKKVTRTRDVLSQDPVTGEFITTTITETDTTQEMAVNRTEARFGWDISKQTVRETKSESSVRTDKGAITRFEDSIRAKLPPAEQGERALRIASLTNPFTAAPVVASVLTERFNPNAAGGAQTVEMLVGYRGQYAEFRERPLATGTSYAIGLGFGGITRGAGAVGTRISKVGPTAEKAVRYSGRGAGLVLGGMYATDVGIRSTKGLTDFDPTRVAQRAIVTSKHELVPLTVGFVHGYSAPETLAGGYRFARAGVESAPARLRAFSESASAKIQSVRRNIPTADSIRYKWVELREPGTAMSVPAASERFGFTQQARGISNSNKWVEANRIAMRSSGTRPAAGRGTVSGRPTPRQESLRLNYNPTAPLREINTNLATSSRAKGILSGIRGSLKGKWDTASAAADEFAHLPLKARWKAREAALSAPQSSKGYFGSGKPTGGLQSGVGEFGTTVRSGRQSLEIRMPSSGVSTSVESLAPQRLEIMPSRRTAQRSRAFDMDFEYEGRTLPSGMRRPAASQDIAVRPLQGVRASPMFTTVPRQVPVQSSAQKQITKPSLFSESKFEVRSGVTNDQKRESLIIPLQAPDTAAMLGIKTAPVTVQAIIQRQRQVTVQEPVLATSTFADSSRVTRPDRRTTRTPFTETTVTRTSKTTLPPGFMLPDAGGSAGDRPFSPGGSYGWSHLNIMADMEYLSHGMAPAPFTTRRKKKKSIFG